MHYAVPRNWRLPPLDVTLVQQLTTVKSLGRKGAGQAGCIAAPQT
jgi:carbon-monoxide dehydrogenase large subunit